MIFVILLRTAVRMIELMVLMLVAKEQLKHFAIKRMVNLEKSMQKVWVDCLVFKPREGSCLHDQLI